MARILSSFICCVKNKRCFLSSNSFTFMDLFLIILSIGSFLVDIGTDIIVICQYYKNGHFLWLILTTILVCVPSMIVQIFSIRWYIIDGNVTNFLWIFHIFQLGLFYRFIQLLNEGFRVRKSKSSSDLAKFNHQQNDICMLRLFESFTESAPQLILQLYIMVSTDEWNPWTGVSAVASIVSLSWGIAAYSKAMRNVRPEKKRLSWWGLLFQALWRIGMVSSRIVAMVLFAVAYGYWLILAIGLHWLSMIIWIFIQDTDFCSTWWEERLYNCVVGVIYCFCYFNIKEGRSRYRMALYYSLTVLQNVCFISAFYFSEKSSHNLRDFMAALVPGGMVIGLGSMLLYYRFFHPSGPILLCTGKESKNGNERTTAHSPDANSNFISLKTCRKMFEITDENPKIDFVLSETPVSDDIQVNLNNSSSSVTSRDENLPCSNDLTTSLSFDCCSDSCNNYSSDLNQQAKSFANHHKNINYNLHPVVDSASSQKHYSCLALAQETNFGEDTNVQKKLYNSLPNLDLSCDEGEQSSVGSIGLSNGRNFFSHMERIISSSSDSDIYNPPIIDNAHIIRLNVEANK